MFKTPNYDFYYSNMENTRMLFSNGCSLNLCLDSINHESKSIIFFSQFRDEILKYSIKRYGNPYNVEISRTVLEFYLVMQKLKTDVYNIVEVQEKLNLSEEEATHAIYLLVSHNLLTQFQDHKKVQKKERRYHFSKRGNEFAQTLILVLNDILKRTSSCFKQQFESHFDRQNLQKTDPFSLLSKICALLKSSLDEAMETPFLMVSIKMDMDFQNLNSFSAYSAPGRYNSKDEDLSATDLNKSLTDYLTLNGCTPKRHRKVDDLLYTEKNITLMLPMRITKILDKYKLSDKRTWEPVRRRIITTRKRNPKLAVMTMAEKAKQNEGVISTITDDYVPFMEAIQVDENYENIRRDYEAFSELDMIYIVVHNEAKEMRKQATMNMEKKVMNETLANPENGEVIKNHLVQMKKDAAEYKTELKNMKVKYYGDFIRTGAKGRHTVAELNEMKARKRELKVKILELQKQYDRKKEESNNALMEKIAQLIKTDQDKKQVFSLFEKGKVLDDADVDEVKNMIEKELDDLKNIEDGQKKEIKSLEKITGPITEDKKESKKEKKIQKEKKEKTEKTTPSTEPEPSTETTNPEEKKEK